MQAKAVVARGPGQAAYRAIDVPEPTADDVVVKVQHSWISNGTESSFIRGERIAGDTPWRPGDPSPFPLVPGYQKVGVVEWVGERVGDIKPGEVVFAATSKVNGMYQSGGGHVSPAVTPRSGIWKIPEGTDPLAVSGLVLVQVGYNCGTRPAIKPGEAAVVIGDGLVGHWSAQTLAHRGARVLLAGKHGYRLEQFACGAGDRRVNITKEDPVAVARAWARDGIQVVVDTVGSVEATVAFYPLMQRGGHIVSAGFHGCRGLIDIQPLRNRELTLHAPSGWMQTRMDATMQLVAEGVLQTTPLITHRFPIQQAAQAYDLILNRRAPYLGVILDWQEEDR